MAVIGETPRTAPASVVRLTGLPDWPHRLSELDPIFYEASLTKSFVDAAARAAFRERWLGRYLDRWPNLAHVASTSGGRIVGYIVGAHADPARDPAFGDIGVYRELAHLTPQYPAHLHINLAPDTRNQGIGSRLIADFLSDARADGLPGAHLVTGRDSRNRSFYARNGFDCLAEITWGGTPIVMLGRVL